MKRLLCLVLALCLVAALGGCGGKKNESSSPSSMPPEPTPTPTPIPMAWVVEVKADDGLNVRSSPSTDGEILGLADDGDTLPLLKENASDGWYQVEYKGETAYVFAEYAKPKQVTLDEYNRLRAGGSATGSSGREPSASSAPTESEDPDASKPEDDTSSASEPDASSEAPTSSASGQTNQDGER